MRRRRYGTNSRFEGFTLPELIIALMLLTVGLLALAKTSAVLTFEHAASDRAERAADLASSRLEALRSHPCADDEGVTRIADVDLAWSVTVAGNAALATVSAVWMDRGTRVVHRYESGFSC